MKNSIVRKILMNFELYICQFLLAALVLIIFVDIILRNIFNYSIPWGSEISVYANVWFAYLGASYAAGRSLHNRITSHFVFFPSIVKVISLIISDLVWIAFNLIFFYLSYDFIFNKSNKFWMSQTLHIPMRWIYIILPVGFMLISIRIVQANYISFTSKDEDVESQNY